MGIEEKKLQKNKKKLLDAVKKSQSKVRKQRMSKISASKIKELGIEQMKSEAVLLQEGVGAPRKITPEMEKILFSYYVAGASINQLHKEFGEKLGGISLDSFYNARDFYLWEQKKASISNLIANDKVLQIADRFKDYLSFLDDLVSDSIVRFTDNSKSGANKNPFNTLKINNMSDLKTVVELMVNLAQGGTKHVKIAVKDFSNNREEKKGYQNLSDKKASKLLEILACDDEDEEN